MEKHLESLDKATNNLRIADHIIYITYPLIKDKKLLLKALDQIYEGLLSTINSILQYDYLWKRIRLYQDPRENFETFINKCAKRYNISDQDVRELMAFLNLMESHRKSPMEFIRREKIVILSENLSTTQLDLERLKNDLNFAKRIHYRARCVLSQNQ